LECKADEVEILDWLLGFQRKKRNIIVPHYVFRINPRRKHPFAPHIGQAVQQRIQDLQTKVAHADFVDIREAQCEADIGFGFVYRVAFAADVACGFRQRD
jgi:hypothetical protein